jgi:hypothetical protein
MDETKLVKIYSAATSIEAHTVANALETAGIEARVFDELSGGFPGTFPTQAPSVCVWKKDETKAGELLDQWQKNAKK